MTHNWTVNELYNHLKTLVKDKKGDYVVNICVDKAFTPSFIVDVNDKYKEIFLEENYK